jgi:hypothetical protein
VIRAEHDAPFTRVERARLAAEILIAYGRVRLLLRRHPLPEVLVRLRGRSGVAPVAATEARLASAVERVLAFVPADTRCLIRSLVLLAVLERRSVATTLVIGASADAGFQAHAWIERHGVALLWPGDTELGRLVEL